MNDLPKHKTHHVSPLIKILKGVSLKSKCSSVGGRHFIIRSLHSNLPNPHPAPETCTNTQARSVKPQEVYQQSPIHSSHLPCLHTGLLAPWLCSPASLFISVLLLPPGENPLTLSPFLLRLILKSSLVFVLHGGKGYKSTKRGLACPSPCRLDRALPLEGSPGTTGTSGELVRDAESWVLTLTS